MSERERMNKIIHWISLIALAIFLKGHECVIPGTCKDLMFVDNQREIRHGHIKTVTGDSKTGMVLYETISNADNKIYFAYISPICKMGNLYRYNCLALKTFSTKAELEQKNSEYCYDQDIRINAECRLASMRIINGVLFCELEPGLYSSKPRIAKISITTGQIIKTRELPDAKVSTLCLKTRDRSWNPQATGEYADVTVHTFVDGTETWILYESASNTAKSIVEQIDMADLSSVQKITVDKIDSTNKVLLICGKLYVMQASSSSSSKYLKINKAIDIYNPKNAMSRDINLIKSLPVANRYAWVHYNPKLNELFVGLPDRDTLVFNVALCDYNQADTRNIDLTRIQSTFFWSLSATEPNHLTALVDTVTSFFRIDNVTELDYTTRLLLVCPLRACALDMNSQLNQYCRIKSTITTLKTYSDYKQIKPTKKKMLQIHFHMDKILHQQNYKTMASQLNVLQTFMSKGFTELKTEVDALRQNVGTYLTELANYDKQTAQSDMNLVYRYMNDFKKRAETLSKKVNNKIETMIVGAQISASLDLLAKVSKVIIAMVAACNPLETMVDTSGVLMDVQESIDAVTKAASKLVQLTTTISFLPKMKAMHQNLTEKIKSNEVKYKRIIELVNKTYNGETLTEEKLINISATFLQEYDSYEPGYLPSSISDVGNMISAIINEFCEILFNGDTTPSAAVQIVFHTLGTCFDSKIDLAALMAVYQDMYEKQDALFDAFASAVRASIAKFNAERIVTINNAVDGNAVRWTHVNLKVFTLELFVSSEVHRLVLVHEACNLVQYKNAGVMPDYCKNVIINPQGSSFDNLVAYKFNADMCDQDEISKYVQIPAEVVKTGVANIRKLPKGTIDLNALYGGEETYFQIPDKQWLIQNGWINSNENPAMIILKQFELFLPFENNASAPVTSVSVRSSLQFSGSNLISPDGPSYDFNVPGKYQYNFRYNQNEYSCLNPLGGTLPYEVPGCTKPHKICLLSGGTVENAIYYPSIFSRWNLDTTVTGNLIAPNPKGDFSLRARVKFCFLNPTKVSSGRDLKEEKSERRSESSINRRKRNVVCCATNNKYYDAQNMQDHCQSCPQGSSPKLQGYYCG